LWEDGFEEEIFFKETRMSFKVVLAFGLSLVFLSGCSSSKLKERKEQRDRVAQSSKMYCEFINGDLFPDIDVAVNLEMAKRCDSDKPYSISQYNTRSDSTGIMYCCTVSPGKMSAVAPAASGKKDSKKDGKEDEIIE
jgi:hypothetical protein